MPRFEHRPSHLGSSRPTSGWSAARTAGRSDAGLAAGGPHRSSRSALELVATAATAASRFARPGPCPDAGRTQWRQWCDGIALVRAQRADFAEYWRQRNEQALTGRGPLWVVLGDSAAQGLGADHPQLGYVGQAHAELVARTGRPWRVLNLSASGAMIQTVLREQLTRLATLPTAPDLVTCGVGTNDLCRLPAPRVRAQVQALIDALPARTVMLDVPVPVDRWGIGRIAAPYVTRVNATLHAAAEARRLPVAYISRHFTPPWAGKFGPDDFHPNAAGYRDWCQAVLAAVPGIGSSRNRSAA
jgi:lysophospholipase L1-like esterase